MVPQAALFAPQVEALQQQALEAESSCTKLAEELGQIKSERQQWEHSPLHSWEHETQAQRMKALEAENRKWKEQVRAVTPDADAGADAPLAGPRGGGPGWQGTAGWVVLCTGTARYPMLHAGAAPGQGPTPREPPPQGWIRTAVHRRRRAGGGGGRPPPGPSSPSNVWG